MSLRLTAVSISARPCYQQCVLPRLCFIQHQDSLLSVPQPAPFWTRTRGVERSESDLPSTPRHSSQRLSTLVRCLLASIERSTIFHHFEVPWAQCVSVLGSFTRKDECHSLISILGLRLPRNNSISTQTRTPHAHCMLSCQQGCPSRYELNERGC